MALLEVERKFIFLPDLISIFKLNKGNPKFQSLKYNGSSIFRDTYYDTSNMLSTHGIWLRKRDKAWELKRRIHGNFQQASYEELKCPERIQSLISKHIPWALSSSENYGLDVLCDYTTKRELHLADEKFSIMLDQTDFGHSVCEVELLARDAKAAEEDIDRFRRKYSWFFRADRPKGKISAYLEKYGPGIRKNYHPVLHAEGDTIIN